MRQSTVKNTAIFLAMLFGWGGSSTASDVCDRISHLSIAERAAAVCQEIRKLPVAFQGKCIDLAYMKQEGRSARRGLRFVADGSKFFCSELNTSDVVVVKVFDGRRSADILHHPDGGIRQVTFDCQPFKCPADFWMLAWTFDLKVFRDPPETDLSKREIGTNIDGLCQRVLACQSIEMLNHERYGKVLSCSDEEQTRENRLASSTYFFGERNGFLVLVGAETMSQAPYSEGDWLLIGRQSWWIEYDGLDDLLVPASWGRSVYQEQREYDGSLKQKADIQYDATFDVSESKISNTFPDTVLEFTVPATATVRDMCIERSE